MRTDLFHYELPRELIAQHPLERRTDARLLTLDGSTGALTDKLVPDILELLNPGDLLVFNNTRVVPARLFGTKQSGGRVEVLVERVENERELVALIKSSKAPKINSIIKIGDKFDFSVHARDGMFFRLQNESESGVNEILECAGHIPLPPYIDRVDNVVDRERYQTVYGKFPGAVAAPTAGLHFDKGLMSTLSEGGIELGFVTLHVGAGTFQPVRTASVEVHKMHSERFEISENLCLQVERAREANKRVVAIGTTSVRALESAVIGGHLRPFRGDTDIFIYPGYRFQLVDAMLTNFHLPESTLLMLVSAFAGIGNIMRAYEHAIQTGYRFFSYGDAMWITRPDWN